MTEYEVPARVTPSRSVWPVLLSLLLIVALAGTGYAGWLLWQQRAATEETVAAQDTLLRRLSRQLGDASAEIQQLRQRQSDVAEAARRNTDTLGSLASRADDADATLARINTTIQGGRSRAQLVAVEQLLLIANERARLAHDAKGAADALTLAQDRLGALAEPQLFAIRESLAAERGALQALPGVDLEASGLSLSALIRRAPQFPQRSRTPAQTSVVDAGPSRDLKPAGDSAWSRGWSSFREVLGAVFILRRNDKPVDRLLPPEQEVLVGQLLLMKLETARAALLARQTGVMRATIEDVDAFLDDYYRSDDPAVLGARAELDRLQSLDLDPPLPELGRSLGLLRAYLDATPR
ncbi:uroporphyrinogen-III C-methyltransferase [uncultured Nevskia sp.]|uniref:uroporphyrinogen-III C-methyltransferase n=1 Tax=uncultured Nevskia sp. TaxID=228950 RepID=UPI0025F34FC6|nr:uroporphyrinogen-III C-methyltransferase [uncultured Nevskia sp.]